MSYSIVIMDENGVSRTCYSTQNHSDGDYSLSVINPILDMDIENGGTLEFVLPPQNIFGLKTQSYVDRISDGTEIDVETFSLMSYTVFVYEDQDVIWVGRPTAIYEDFYNRTKVQCEGALNFLHDSVQPKVEYNKTTLINFLQALLNYHNEGQTNKRKIYIDYSEIDYYEVSNPHVTTSDKFWRQTDWESTYDCLKKYVLDSIGGYAMIIWKNNHLVLKYWNDFRAAVESSQTINFGANLLDFTRSWDASSVVTDVIPVCHYTYNGIDRVYDITSINDGVPYVRDQSAFETYGRIAKVIDVEMVQDLTDTTDISDPQEKEEAITTNNMIIENTKSEMLAQATVELAKNREAEMVIEVTAADLSKYATGNNEQPFKLGQTVHVISEPHDVDTLLPISRIQIDLTSGQKKLTIGTPKKKNLTEIYKPKKKS